MDVRIGSYYNTTFSLPLEFFWNTYFDPLVAITDPASSKKDFTYSISTGASSVEGKGYPLFHVVVPDGSLPIEEA